MRLSPIVLVCVLACAVPLAALAADAPPPAAVAACQAEYVQLGADAFKATYGPTEPFGHCYAAHTATPPPVTTTTSAPSGDAATAACQAEYVALGPDAFRAKYGAPETFGNCLAAHKQQPAATGSGDAAKSLAQALCKGGTGSLGQCVKATLAKARAIVAACKSSSGPNKDAYRACLAAAAPKRR